MQLLSETAMAQPNHPAAPLGILCPSESKVPIDLMTDGSIAECGTKPRGSAKKLEPEKAWGSKCFMAYHWVLGCFLEKDDDAFEKTKLLLLMMGWISARTVKTHHLLDGDILNSFHPGKWFSLGKNRVSALINDVKKQPRCVKPGKEKGGKACRTRPLQPALPPEQSSAPKFCCSAVLSDVHHQQHPPHPSICLFSLIQNQVTTCNASDIVNTLPKAAAQPYARASPPLQHPLFPPQ